MSDPRRELGRRGEQAAVVHLTRRGFQIVERNFRTRWGELDIVAFDGSALAFCEVKSRRGVAGTAHPLEAIGAAKQLQVRRIAAQWLHERRDRPRAAVLRFDAIGVTFDSSGELCELEHLEDVF